MNKLEHEIKQMEILLSGTYAELNDISNENFSDKMEQIKKKINLVIAQKKQLLMRYQTQELKNYNEKLNSLSKQIGKIVDNLIETYRTESLEIAQKLVQIGNRKKIANYLG